MANLRWFTIMVNLENIASEWLMSIMYHNIIVLQNLFKLLSHLAVVWFQQRNSFVVSKPRFAITCNTFKKFVGVFPKQKMNITNAS